MRGSNADNLQTLKRSETKNEDPNANEFQVRARRIEIEPHDNADALELARIDNYRAVVKKGEFSSGDLIIYIPEASLVPDQIIKEMNLEGRLAGSNKNRVKAVKLRGALSQGLVYKPSFPLEEGKDYKDELGIVKWKPPIPANMSGEVEACPRIKSYTDIANIKRYPLVIKNNEEVWMTEKLHGTSCISALINDELHVSSKGLASKSLALKDSESNVYWRETRRNNLEEVLRTVRDRFAGPGEVVQIHGEVLGVQDLMYGLQKGDLDYRAFDIRVGEKFLDIDDFNSICEELGVETVPPVYRGPFSEETLAQVTKGKETFTGSEAHIREGVVVRPVKERSDPEVGRVILKSISEDYLLRKGNATELE